MRKAFSAVVLTLLLVAWASPVSAITYGQPTGDRYGNVGSLVIEIDDAYYQLCTGTLIDDGVMLTAAHCLVGLPDGALYVTFDPDIEPSGLIAVRDTATHPSFGKNTANLYDLGLVWFRAGAVSATPAPIAPLDYLSEMSKRERKEATFTAVGYGTIRESRKKGWQGILDNTERRFVHQGFLSLQKAWLTLSMNQSTGNGGTCYGDSGGPHFLDGFIVSLTVTGDTVCKATDKTYRLDRPWVYRFLRAHDVI